MKKIIFLMLVSTFVFGCISEDDKKKDASDYIAVTDYEITDINSVWGIDVSISFDVVSLESLDYIYFDVEVYNNVNDIIPEEIYENTVKACYTIGPYKNGDKKTSYWSLIGYYPGAKYLKVKPSSVILSKGDEIEFK